MQSVVAGFLDLLKHPAKRPMGGENALSLALSPRMLTDFIKKTPLRGYVLTDVETYPVPKGVEAEFTLASGRADLTRQVKYEFEPLRRALQGYAEVPVLMDVVPHFANEDDIYDKYTDKYTVTFTAKTPVGAVNASAQRVATLYLKLAGLEPGDLGLLRRELELRNKVLQDEMPVDFLPVFGRAKRMGFFKPGPHGTWLPTEPLLKALRLRFNTWL